jgi:5-methylcytosine-specific restriction endonuclease McrA
MKHKRRVFSKKFRKDIFERDNYECQLCYYNLIDKPDLRVIDHKIPLSKGGSNSISNLWLLCNDCDKRKKNKVFPELMKQYIKGKLNYLANLRFNGNRNNK